MVLSFCPSHCPSASLWNQEIQINILQSSEEALIKYWQIMKQIQQNQNSIILCTDGAKNKNSTAATVNLTTFIKGWKDFWHILNNFSILLQETK